ncbi:hypothetical protein MASR2M18_10070 [Ignavibacteria bacterium]|nr:hypothetical protein [Bacteroidota bacterium]MCZ2133724.1 hypothetical protein [Bacteroidota bacterium]
MNTPGSLFFIGLCGSLAALLIINYLLSLRRKRLAFRRILGSVRLSSPTSYLADFPLLPPPVERYLSLVINNNSSRYRLASLTISGQFRRNERAGWQRLNARAMYNCSEPSFAWFGYFGNLFFHTLTALLTLNNGKGRSSLLFFHSIPLLSSSGAETDISLLSRYLSEAVYFPFIFRNVKLFKWSPLTETTASLEMTFLQNKIHATVAFDSNGYISDITITDKFRDFKGFFEKQTFHAYYSDYQKFHNILVPTSLRYSWETSDEDFPYAQLNVSHLSYT